MIQDEENCWRGPPSLLYLIIPSLTVISTPDTL